MRVAFYSRWRFHRDILNPISKYFDNTEKMMIDMEYNQTDILPTTRDIIDFNPNVIVLADDIYHLIDIRNIPASPVYVQVHHTVINKFNKYNPNHVEASYICVNSRYDVSEYTRRGIMPKVKFWFTGYTPMDILFKGEETVTLQQLGLTQSQTVLYAPTYNLDLNSVELLGMKLVDIIRNAVPNVNIIIKSHPAFSRKNPSWHIKYKQLADSYDNVIYIEDNDVDIMPLMLLSDIMISDISGVVYEYLVLDKPVILYTSFTQNKSVYYDSEGPEVQHRNVGDNFDSIRKLQDALRNAMFNPQQYSRVRNKVRDIFFDKDLQDCNASRRIADHIKSLEVL